jgi:hypothetical protein
MSGKGNYCGNFSDKTAHFMGLLKLQPFGPYPKIAPFIWCRLLGGLALIFKIIRYLLAL